ncbi:tRNA uridine-5-carboxymethylaminomethyl(34) synthesis enzyme MnmG [Candidatus Dependentiae bacterium]|nr:tRNA uridine-5-carboxymethylaminomethyl(34) synthesis enzyme MnmG [Candidatus Dependentiae bacterium]
MNTTHNFDVIVIGGGHAGVEAAYAAANMGSKTLLITLSVESIGRMPCNPAIGGVGKGHIVFEISALGGLMPKLCTKTYLQVRMLNTRRGPAVQGLRLQIDKFAYNKLCSTTITNTPNITVITASARELLTNAQRAITGVKTEDGMIYSAPCVVVTTGTFLNGLLHFGQSQKPGGRNEEGVSSSLSASLASLGLRLGRLKTGTPPRLARSSLDFSVMAKQDADQLDYLFEFHPHRTTTTRDCYITYTNEQTHEIIRNNLHLSAMYSGNIKGIGPRYCPSIEDKISRFADKTSHHVFVEPEGADSDEIYPNGLSTSLPYEIQECYIRSIKGFEQAIITRPGYAVEYDFVHPEQLNHVLEVKNINGLFLAGQINGTTGYEEAAGQGIIAGINAHLKAHNLPAFTLNRNESYIGVMIDDLVSLGVDEPYRMFTSRAERRLLLRQDNTFLRLTDRAYQLGLIDESTYQDFLHEKNLLERILYDLRQKYTNSQLLKLCEAEYNFEYLKNQLHPALNERMAQTMYAEIRYEPYIQREEKEIQKSLIYQDMIIPASLDYTNMPGLSRELQEKLKKHKPATIAQATLIPGMTPAAISLLIFKTREHRQEI